MNHLQAAIAVIDNEKDQGVMHSTIRALMAGYDKRYDSNEFHIIGVEETLTAPLINPATNAKSRTYELAGKIDVRAMSGAEHIIMDHKSTSMDIADPNDDYWRQLVVDSQAGQYLYLCWLNGVKADAAVWDVVKKPGIRPRQFKSKKELEDLKNTGAWFGFAIERDEVEQAEATGKETLRMYEARLIHDCTVERPDHYFQRRKIRRLDSEIMEFAADLWDVGQEILTAYRHDRHIRNSGACMLYNSACKYLGICSGHDTVDSDKWQRREWVHSELPVLQQPGRSYLTNSRIRSFQTCHRKEQLHYDLGLDRADGEEKETLQFGTLLHSALEAYYLSIKGTQANGNSDATHTAGLGSAGDAGDREMVLG